jgi:hypothetical protein
MKISIQLLWGSVNESRKTIAVTSLINIQTWQECLNYLQPHHQHSNYFSTSLELFAATSSTFQSLLNVPITICTAQFQPLARSALFFNLSDSISELGRVAS